MTGQSVVVVIGSAALALLALGCTGRSPTGPEAPAATLTGTWQGPVEESYGGRGRLRLSIEQTAFALGGTFALTFDDGSRNRTGMIGGSIGVPPVAQRMQLTSSGGLPCEPGQSPESFLVLTWSRSGDRLSGQYDGFGCLGTITGTLTVTRE